MRLIDADALLFIFASKIKKITPIGYSRDAFHHDSGRNGAWVSARIEVNKAPTIDAVPVVHAKWKLNNDGSGTCGNCHRTTVAAWDMDSSLNYCPHCGSRMDGE